MSVVLDASLALAWVLDDEQAPAVDALLDHVTERGAAAPPIWPYEIANALQTACRRGRISQWVRDQAIADLADLHVEVDGDGLDRIWSSTLRFAAQYGLTVYDASYLELAVRRGLPLATLDVALARAARQADIDVLP